MLYSFNIKIKSQKHNRVKLPEPPKHKSRRVKTEISNYLARSEKCLLARWFPFGVYDNATRISSSFSSCMLAFSASLWSQICSSCLVWEIL